MAYTSNYPINDIATDIVVFTFSEEHELEVLLIERKGNPRGWALPGGFLRPDEDLDTCARRELLEETGLRAKSLTHFRNFSRPDRDPRSRVVSAAYLALLPKPQPVHGGSDALTAQWFPLDKRPKPLVFDHEQIIKEALGVLQGKLERQLDALFDFLPKEFTLTRAQRVLEAVSRKPVDKRNFRKLLSAEGLVVPTGKAQPTSTRPAQLFRKK